MAAFEFEKRVEAPETRLAYRILYSVWPIIIVILDIGHGKNV
jgi:hypothetical protein